MKGLTTYDMRFKFEDELNEKEWRLGTVVVYDSSNNTEGATFKHALDCADEDGDYSGVNKLLEPYGIDDDATCFYFDRAGIATESLVLEMQRDFDIVIWSIDEVKL